MDELEAYRTNLLEEVRATAAQGELTHEAFVAVAANKLVGAEELSDWTPSYFRNKGYRRRDLAVDGFFVDDVDVDASVSVLVAAYTGEEKAETMSGAQLSALCDRAIYFVEDALNGRLEDLEPSTRAYDLADWLRGNSARLASIRVYVLTDSILKVRTKELPARALGRIRVEIQVWDIARLWRAEASGGREAIEIDLSEFVPGGIPVLRASQPDADYEAYLCVVPGEILADLYQRYGSRLLEGNVRSFLSVKGGVNKGIRSTILSTPQRFFAYNNGVAATATSASIVASQGVDKLVRLTDFQIVNGGQTTASIFTARRKDQADVSRVFVQIKLSVVTAEQADEVIPLISRYANSQNKVSEADFFANHPFHRRIEELSQRVWAPPAKNTSYQTKWFYERARGQYANELSKLSGAKRNMFALQQPKRQLITKTDLAKVHNSWERLPDIVSLGAQKNFIRFAESIAPMWEAADATFNERWFKVLVGKTLLFDSTEALVSKQSWYQSGYRANIVTYAIALLSELVRRQKRALDFDQIWRAQSLPDPLISTMETLTKAVFDVLTTPPASAANVTEWSKKPACWKAVQALPLSLPKQVGALLVELADEAEGQKDAKKDQQLGNKLARLSYVIQKGSDYWQAALEWNGSRQILSEKERSIITQLATRRGFVPSDAQASVAIDAEQLLKSEGFRRTQDG